MFVTVQINIPLGINFYTSQNLSVMVFYSKIIEFKPIPLIALLYVSLVIGLLKNDVTVQGFTDLVCWLAMSKSNKEFQ